MKHHVAMAAIAISCGLAVLFGFGSAVQAQVQKSGKVTLQYGVHWDVIAQRHSEGSYQVAGRTSGVYVGERRDVFGNGLTVECVIFQDYADLSKGVLTSYVGRCIGRDSSGDLIFSSFQCATKTFADRCEGILTGGTGKYSGISGVQSSPAFAPAYIRRSCIAAPKDEDCRASYATSSAVPIGTTYKLYVEATVPIELEWKIP